MGQTAIISPQIIDATTIGKTVLTASSEGIAADAIGLGATDDVTFNSVDAVDGSYSGNLVSEVNGTIRHYATGTDGDADTSFIEIGDDGTNLTVYGKQSGAGAHKDIRLGNSVHYMQVVPTSAKMEWYVSGIRKLQVTSTNSNFSADLIATTPTYTLGNTSSRWGNVYAVNGSYSGNLNVEVSGSQRVYNLGTEGDTNSEYLETSWDTNRAYIETKATGSGVSRDLFLGSASSGTTVVRGARTQLYDGAALMQNIDSGYNTMYNGVRPSSDGTVTLGYDGRRWSDVYSVDGSYSGNLNTEVGGSQRVYNLGTEGDADTEYLETVVDSGIYCIRTGATGSGSYTKKVYVGTGFSGTNSDRGMTVSNSDAKFIFGGSRFTIAGGAVTTYSKFIPAINGAYPCGEDGKRWSSVASVDGDFSGDVIMAANVDFTGLPTADPVVAGRLWNDSGTLTISAG